MAEHACERPKQSSRKRAIAPPRRISRNSDDEAKVLSELLESAERRLEIEVEEKKLLVVKLGKERDAVKKLQADEAKSKERINELNCESILFSMQLEKAKDRLNVKEAYASSMKAQSRFFQDLSEQEKRKNEELKRAICNHEQTIRRKRQRVEDLLAKLRIERDDAVKRFQADEAKSKERTDQKHVTRNKNEELKRAIHNLKIAAGKNVAKLRIERDAVKRLQTDEAKSKKRISQLKEEAKILSKQLKEQKNVETQLKMLSVLQGKNEELTKAKHNNLKTIGRKNQRIADLLSQVEIERKMLLLQNQSQETLDKKNEYLYKRLETLQLQLSSSKQSVKKSKKDLEQMSSKFKKEAKELSSSSSIERRNSRRTIKTLTARIEELESQLLHEKKNISQDVQKMRTELNSAQIENDRYKQDVSACMFQLTSKKKIISDMENSKAALEDLLDDLREDKAVLEKRLEKVESENSSFAHRLREELESKKKIQTEMDNSLAAKDKALAKKQKRILEYSNELRSFLETIGLTPTQNVKLARKIAEMETTHPKKNVHMQTLLTKPSGANDRECKDAEPNILNIRPSKKRKFRLV